MNKIEFSHRYDKMPPEDWIPNTEFEARLLEVLCCEKDDLSSGFVEYDTSYWVRDYSTSDTFLKKEHYPLPKGKLLILLLLSHNSAGLHLWTTTRRWTPTEEKYYRAKRGESFKIEILEEDGNH